MKFNTVITTFIIGVFVIGGIAILMGLPVMFLWNWLMPVLFKLPTITFVQAIGLNILCNILFKASFTQNKND